MKIISRLILFIIVSIIILIITLSTVGIETNKFNNLIKERASNTKNILLDLETIKFKLDPKELSLFLETENPKISYKELYIPIQNIKVYIDFLSLLKSEPKIRKTSLILKELDINQLKKLSIIIKPSNFKSLLNNKIKEGKLISEIEIYLNNKGELKNFIAKGEIKDLKVELFSKLNLTKTNLNFFADKDDVLIKNIFGNIDNNKIIDGDIKLSLENGVKINSNFNSKIIFDENFYEKHSQLFDDYSYINNIKNLKANLNNNFFISFDNTYKVQDYNYKLSGKIEEGRFEFQNEIKSDLIIEKIKKIYFSDLNIKTIFSPTSNNFKGNGKYSFNNIDYLRLNFENNFKSNFLNLKLDFDYKNGFLFELINYKKPIGSVANISLNLEKKKDLIKFNEVNFSEGDESIKLEGLTFKENNFLSFKKIKVKTFNNDFTISKGKKIFIQGAKFDATNLFKLLKNQGKENTLKRINSDIEIDFKNIKVPMSEQLENFKLIGVIKEGKFIKISSKGDFGGNNFLDISMRKDKNSDKKYLEIYSDLTRPLLTEYGFFNGLSGGTLLFSSIIDNLKSNSKLKIENFKVVNAPGVIKLLSLADLGGLADLTKGDGLSFDLLEIDMEKNKNFLKLNEILALGPSISVLMEGYQDENGLTSLRGTLVPAKTLNKLISKIPLIGDIIIPKEVGEGLFGISFKMKGPKGEVKTTINPIRTLTPRFIQKIIDREKPSK